MNETLYVGGNGFVYAISTHNCGVLWGVELNPGWFVAGSPFVSLRKTDRYLFAFAYGRLYKLDKRSGQILQQSEQLKKLKHRAGVFSTTFDSASMSFDDSVLAGDCGDGDGGGGGDGDGGDGGGD